MENKVKIINNKIRENPESLDVLYIHTYIHVLELEKNKSEIKIRGEPPD